ncbi:hypothetical protein FE257_011331 [Aspergillus nanangensis]|uniref:AMP-dependent synthetase/ligase domain-containing protein n=1 Tax=Aspergillus nanangensis TaxID=2582783 RepID=A0AAD4GQP6_ASPNN|nr:hypothetical protein FE257_011331 [Aspergillus nanangensis]
MDLSAWTFLDLATMLDSFYPSPWRLQANLVSGKLWEIPTKLDNQDQYLSNNPSAMEVAYDTEGFYRTGDIGRLEDGNLFVLGCVSEDVSQAIVLGIPRPTENQKVGALLVTREAPLVIPCLTLPRLRKWLAIQRGMPAYMLPTVLRTLEAKQAHQVPCTV